MSSHFLIFLMLLKKIIFNLDIYESQMEISCRLNMDLGSNMKLHPIIQGFILYYSVYPVLQSVYHTPLVQVIYNRSLLLFVLKGGRLNFFSKHKIMLLLLFSLYVGLIFHVFLLHLVF